ELGSLWGPAAEKRMVKWSQVRAGWPDRRIKLFGPGMESGTYDDFTQAVTGTAGASRKDYTASADAKGIVDGVAADAGALAYVGFSRFEADHARLKALRINNGGRAIEPSVDSVDRGLYRPFSRPLFVYVNQARLNRPEVKMFVDHYLRRAGELAKGVG